MIRPADIDELRFVRSSWLKSYASSDWAKLVTPPPVWLARREGGGEYFVGHRDLIDRILASRTGRVIVEATDSIVEGWCCFDPLVPALHYVYVRQTARGAGVARALVYATGMDLLALRYTHRSRDINGPRVPRGWRFDPYPLIGYPPVRKMVAA